MVSSFYNITEFFNRISLAHPNITTFTFGNLDDIDLAKQTQFPLAHLIVNNVEVASGKITYDVSYMVMDKVANITPESTGKNNSLVKDYIGVDNSIDVWNSSLETINNIYSYIQRNPDNLDYDIDGDAVLTPFKDRFDNLLAGWGADFSITVGNENNICVLDPMTLEYVLPAIDMARVSVSASYAQSSSYADTASFFSGSIEDALRAISSSYSLSSSFSLTASYVALPATYSQAYTASYALHAGNSMSASWASSSVSSSQSITASYAHTASYVALPATYSQAFTASYSFTASYALNAGGGDSISSSWASSSISSSHALTASYVALPPTYSQAYTASIVTSSNAEYNVRIDGTQTGIIYNDADYSNYSYLTVSKGYTGLAMNSASVYTAVEASNQYSNPNVTIASADFNTGKQSVASFTTESIYLGANGSGNTGNITIKPEAIQLNGPVTASSIRATAGFTGSLNGTASFAHTASYINDINRLTVGVNNTASADYALAAGQTNLASGYSAISLGAVNRSTGDTSITIGSYLSSSVTQQTVIGNYNNPSSTAAVVIANGLSEGNRYNAMEFYDTKTVVSGTLEVSGNIIGLINSSSYASSSLSASYAVTTSYAYNMEVANNLTIKGVLSASIFYADSASIVFTSGSNNFGNQITDLQILTGSVIITGSLSTTSPSYLSNITGSLYGTASFATTASYVALPATYSQAYTASYIQNAQYATASLSSSFAETASYYDISNITGSVLTTGSSGLSQPLSGILNVSGSIIITGSGQGGIQTHTLQLNGAVGNAINYRGTNNSTGNTSSLVLGTGASGFTYININNNGTASSEIRGTNTQASLTYTFSGSSNIIRANSTGVEVIGRSFSTGIVPVTASSIRATSGFTGSLDGTASFALTASMVISSSFASSSQFLNNTSSTNFVSNITDTFTASAAITNIVTLTQVEYDAITTKSSSTVYYII